MAKCNISFFIPHMGCPHKCSFCNQNSITGQSDIPHGEDIRNTLIKAMTDISEPDRDETEIAFFGGSFTAINREYMLELLSSAQQFIGEGKFGGIRISTRPDYIDRDILSLLKDNHVTTIELGCQSMSDTVLSANERGHSRQDVIDSSRLIKEYGFRLGLQMMVGLYKSTPEIDLCTAQEIVKLSPDEARIYPVVIMKHTRLGDMFKSSEYVPYSFERAVELSAQILSLFEENGISVIKLGLHASEVVEKDCLGGFYHPAFRELCESELYKKEILKMLECECSNVGKATVSVRPELVSKIIGQKKSNIEFFRSIGIEITVTQDNRQKEKIRLIKTE